MSSLKYPLFVNLHFSSASGAVHENLKLLKNVSHYLHIDGLARRLCDVGLLWIL